MSWAKEAKDTLAKGEYITIHPHQGMSDTAAKLEATRQRRRDLERQAREMQDQIQPLYEEASNLEEVEKVLRVQLLKETNAAELFAPFNWVAEERDIRLRDRVSYKIPGAALRHVPAKRTSYDKELDHLCIALNFGDSGIVQLEDYAELHISHSDIWIDIDELSQVQTFCEEWGIVPDWSEFQRKVNEKILEAEKRAQELVELRGHLDGMVAALED